MTGWELDPEVFGYFLGGACLIVVWHACIWFRDG